MQEETKKEDWEQGTSPIVQTALDNLTIHWSREDLVSVLEGLGYPATGRNIEQLAEKIDRGFHETLVAEVNERLAMLASMTDFLDAKTSAK